MSIRFENAKIIHIPNKYMEFFCKGKVIIKDGDSLLKDKRIMELTRRMYDGHREKEKLEENLSIDKIIALARERARQALKIGEARLAEWEAQQSDEPIIIESDNGGSNRGDTDAKVRNSNPQ